MSSTKITDEKLHELIWEGIELKKEDGEVKMLIPSDIFGISGGTPFCVTVRSIKAEHESMGPFRQRTGCLVDDTKYDEFEISDGGRVISELEGRVGSIDELMPLIERILYKTGMHTLRGGRIINRSYSFYSSFLHTSTLCNFILATSLISNLDLIRVNHQEDDEDDEYPTPCSEKAKKKAHAPNAELLENLYLSLRSNYEIRSSHDEQLILFDMFFDGEGSALNFSINPDKTMTIKSDRNFADWVWRPCPQSDEYIAAALSVAKRYGVALNEDLSEVSINFRRNEMTVASAMYRVMAVTLVISALDWCVGIA